MRFDDGMDIVLFKELKLIYYKRISVMSMVFFFLFIFIGGV